MNARSVLVTILFASTALGLAACSSGPNSSGFVPATPQTASAARTPKDNILPHP